MHLRAVTRYETNSAGSACISIVVAVAMLLGSAAVVFAQSTGVTLQKLADYPLPGDTSRYDYLTFDPTSHRMYIAHLGQGVVHVFDTRSHTLIGTIERVPGVHGALAVPELGVVFASATSTNSVAVIDPQTLSVSATIPGGEYPDGLAYASSVGKLYVPNAGPNAHSIGLDTETRHVYLPTANILGVPVLREMFLQTLPEPDD